MSVPFEVVGRSKTERIDKKGNRETIYKVTLKLKNGDRLILSDSDVALVQKYPLQSDVDVKIGNSNQTTLKEV